MTEADWLAAEVPQPLLAFIRDKVPIRKLRLFAVACCRKIWPIYRDYDACRAVVVAEQIADGLTVRENLSDFRIKLYCRGFNFIDGYRQEKENNFYWNLLHAGMDILETYDAEDNNRVFGPYPPNINNTHVMIAQAVAHWERRTDMVPVNPQHVRQEMIEQVPLLRDIFGNPFRPVAFDPAWQTSTAVALAQTMYDARDFAAIPILADALEDAGCEVPEVLSHCRDPKGTHVRGCWVVDLVLGKC